MLEIFAPLLLLPPIKMTIDAMVLGFKLLQITAFLWGPFIMWEMAKGIKKSLKPLEFLQKQSFVLLEISIPRAMQKSPLAMELVLNAIHQSDIWFSLEMVSLEGKVRFFVYTPKDYVRHLQNHLYAQYPDLEVREADFDYVPRRPYSKEPEKYEIYGVEYKLAKDDFFPIKTYAEYGLDKLDIKEEFKIDPLTPLIETLGSVGRGQEMWIQIMVQASGKRFKKEVKEAVYWYEPWKKDWWKHQTGDISKGTWIDQYAKKVDEMKEKAKTKREQDVLHSVQRAMVKPAFDTGIRAIYIAEKDKYDKTQVNSLKQIFKTFGSGDLNSFDVNKAKETNISFGWDEVVDFPIIGRTKLADQGVASDVNFYDFWHAKELASELLAKRKKKFYLSYLDRAFFYAKGKPFILSSEELATIFHFPGQVSATPTFARIESRKVAPPPELVNVI